MTAQDYFTQAERIKAVFREMTFFHIVYVSVTTTTLIVGLHRTERSAPSEMKAMFKCKTDEEGKKTSIS